METEQEIRLIQLNIFMEQNSNREVKGVAQRYKKSSAF